MRMSRLVLAAALVTAFASAGWAQGVQFVRVPVTGTYWDASIGEDVKYAGELRITWNGQSSWEFLIADATCACGEVFTVYGLSRQPAANGIPDVEMLHKRSLTMIGVGHTPGFSGAVEVDLASATIGSPVIAAQ